MRDSGQAQRPVIVVLADGADTLMREVLAGIEEEGVPFAALPVVDADRGSAAAHLAIRAAGESPLQVGVGIGAGGDICVCHARLDQPIYALAAVSTTSPAARTLGHNAARIVTALPLRMLPDS